MIVDDLDILGGVVNPPKTHTPPLINPDAVDALSVTAKFFQAVSGRIAKVFEPRRSVQKEELANRRSFEGAPLARYSAFFVKEPRSPVFEAPDHKELYGMFIIPVKTEPSLQAANR